MSLYGGSNLGDNIHNLVERSDDNTSDSEAEGQELIKGIEQRIYELLKQQGDLFLTIQQKLLIILF